MSKKVFSLLKFCSKLLLSKLFYKAKWWNNSRGFNWQSCVILCWNGVFIAHLLKFTSRHEYRSNLSTHAIIHLMARDLKESAIVLPAKINDSRPQNSHRLFYLMFQRWLMEKWNTTFCLIECFILKIVHEQKQVLLALLVSAARCSHIPKTFALKTENSLNMKSDVIWLQPAAKTSGAWKIFLCRWTFFKKKNL